MEENSWRNAVTSVEEQNENKTNNHSSDSENETLQRPRNTSDLTEHQITAQSQEKQNENDSNNYSSVSDNKISQTPERTPNTPEDKITTRLEEEHNENDTNNYSSDSENEIFQTPESTSDIEEQIAVQLQEEQNENKTNNHSSDSENETLQRPGNAPDITEQQIRAQSQGEQNENDTNDYSSVSEKEILQTPGITSDVTEQRISPQTQEKQRETTNSNDTSKSEKQIIQTPGITSAATEQQIIVKLQAVNKKNEVKIKDLKAKVIFMKHVTEQQKDEIEKLKKENKKLQERMDNMANVSRKRTDMYKARSKRLYKSEELQKQIMIYNSRISALEHLYKEQSKKDTEQIGDLQKQISICNSKNATLEDHLSRLKHEYSRKTSLLTSTQIQIDLYREQNKKDVVQICELQKQIRICNSRTAILEEALQEFGNSENRLKAEIIVLKQELKDKRKQSIHYQEKLQRQQREIDQSEQREISEQIRILGQEKENPLKETENKDEMIATLQRQNQQQKAKFQGLCKTNHRYLQQIADMAASMQIYRETTDECHRKLNL